MLRKRSRSHQKDPQNMGQDHHLIPDSSSSSSSCYSNSDAFLKQKHKPNSFFTVPGLFVGLNPKNPESDSVRSPTSPLDFKVFSKPNLVALPFRSSKQPSNEGTQKSWDSNKVGLSIIESLKDEMKPSSGKVLRSSDSKTILFAPQLIVMNNPSLKSTCLQPLEPPSNSLPKNYAVFPFNQMKQSNPEMINPSGQELCAKFSSHSFDSTKSGSHLNRLIAGPTKLSNVNFGSPNGQNPSKELVSSLSASEIELSEDYTCVRKHGPNPKTTHIFGDCILECHDDMFIAKPSKDEGLEAASPLYPSDDFLSFCYTCKKKLEGEDIYMYRGETAFCSWTCRSQEILMDEEMEKTEPDWPRSP